MIKISYQAFKNSVILNNQSFLEEEHLYSLKIIGTFDNLPVECLIDKTTEDFQDYILNYRALVNIPKFDIDDDGRQVTRSAAAIKGSVYGALFFEFETSSGELVALDAYGNDISSTFSVTRYDNLGNVTISNLNTIRTEITWKPTYDYELIGGSIRQPTLPSTNIYLGVVGKDGNVGVYDKVFTQGLNLKLLALGDTIEIDGRTSKYMAHSTAGVPFPTNNIKIIAKHDAGVQHWVMVNFEIFRE